jgi:N-acetylneuraminate synthase
MTRIFEDLFVLEMANNHLGSIDRGLKIIKDFGRIIYYNGVRAAIKLQLRDVSTFVHKDFCTSECRYIKKITATQLPREAYHTFADAIRKEGCMVCATCFDERSVELAVEIGCEVLKIASSDVADWGLLRKMASTKLPVIVSTGGTSLADIDNVVKFFKNRHIPLAINHCVALYPTADEDLELNQIDFLRNRYPDHVIGLSTHEYTDWQTSIAIAVAKGARTYERHVDINADGVTVSPYCSLPHQVDAWFKAWAKAKEMCGAPGCEKRLPPRKEIEYLDALVRGAYATRDLEVGHVLQEGDLYLAVPLQKGQLCNREHLSCEMLIRSLRKDDPLTIGHLDNDYSRDPKLRAHIENRGL